MTSPTTVKPPRLRPGDTVGVFTPSFPAHVRFREKYLHGLAVLRGLGFDVVEGDLTRALGDEGYRSGSPRERADEFMGLVRNPRVRALVSCVGGSNSASLLPHLDFDEIRATPKIVCGYSDVTSLHLSILAHSGLRTFYGPAVMPSFGEWPDVLPETRESFLDAVLGRGPAMRELAPPARWSNHFRDAAGSAWKDVPRDFHPNPGWRSLHPGEVTAPLVVANLNTLMTSAGTDVFPDVEGRVLLIEEMDAALSEEERDLRHLERLGVFDAVAGLIVGKPERYDAQGARFGYDDLVLEIVGADRPYPIVTGFDCGHTVPMLTLAEHTTVTVTARAGEAARVRVEEHMVTD